MRKYRRELTRLARDYGRTLETTRGGHIRLVHPDAPDVFVAATPSCSRALSNIKAELARRGGRAEG